MSLYKTVESDVKTLINKACSIQEKNKKWSVTQHKISSTHVEPYYKRITLVCLITAHWSPFGTATPPLKGHDMSIGTALRRCNATASASLAGLQQRIQCRTDNPCIRALILLMQELLAEGRSWKLFLLISCVSLYCSLTAVRQCPRHMLYKLFTGKNSAVGGLKSTLGEQSRSGIIWEGKAMQE